MLTTWTRSFTTTTTASASSVWTRWVTAKHWIEDDPETEVVVFDEPPKVGTEGRVKDVHSAEQQIRFTRLRAQHEMAFSVGLPGATLTFPHSMEATPLGLRVTHGVTFTGPLAALYGLLVGRRIARGLPTVVGRVLAAALRDGASTPLRGSKP